MPAIGGIGIAQQGVDLLADSPIAVRRLSADGSVNRFAPDDSPRQPVGDGQLPVQAVSPRHKLKPREGEAIAAA